MNITRILVPTDFSEASRGALAVAADFAKQLGAQITLVHGFEVPAYAYAGLGMTTVDYLSPIEDGAREVLKAELRSLAATLPAPSLCSERECPGSRSSPRSRRWARTWSSWAPTADRDCVTRCSAASPRRSSGFLPSRS